MNSQCRARTWSLWLGGGTLLLLLSACQPEVASAPVVDGPHPQQRADSLRMALQEAQNAWSTGRRAEAKTKVQFAYQHWFEPIEPLLRREDAVGTLAVEFKFGALAARMGQKGDPVAMNDAVMKLLTELDVLVARLPAPPPEAMVDTTSALDALPVAIEVVPPAREFTTYGDAKED